MATEDKKTNQEVKKVEHKNIYEALSAFQGECPVIDTTKEVSFGTRSGAQLKFKYAPLSEIVKVVGPLLGKHGLSFTHEIGEKGLQCVLTHVSAKSDLGVSDEKEEKEDMKIVVNKKYTLNFQNQISSGYVPIKRSDDMKEVGASITYARRYTLGLVLGIASEEDKDAELLEERREKAEKFAFTTVKNGIMKAKPTELPAKKEFLQKELEQVKAGKTGSLGLDEAQYNELIALVESRLTPKSEDQNGNEQPTE